MVIISILLLAVLFLAGLINLFFYFPTNKFYTWFRSLILRRKYSDAAAAASDDCPTAAGKKGLTAGKKAELKKAFKTFDRDGDGFITKQELRESMKNIGVVLTAKDAEEMVEKVDANNDGLIDPEEFCELYESMRSGGGGGGEEEEAEEEEEVMKEAFDVFDADKDGWISVEELRSVLSSLGLKEGARVEDCKEMIRKVDMDGDGKVSFEEFKKMMRAGGKSLLLASD